METVNVLNPMPAVAASPLPGLIADLRAKSEDLARSHALTRRIIAEIQALLNGTGAVVIGNSTEAREARTAIDRATQNVSPDPHDGSMANRLFQAVNALEDYRKTTKA